MEQLPKETPEVIMDTHADDREEESFVVLQSTAPEVAQDTMAVSDHVWEILWWMIAIPRCWISPWKPPTSIQMLQLASTAAWSARFSRPTRVSPGKRSPRLLFHRPWTLTRSRAVSRSVLF